MQIVISWRLGCDASVGWEHKGANNFPEKPLICFWMLQSPEVAIGNWSWVEDAPPFWKTCYGNTNGANLTQKFDNAYYWRERLYLVSVLDNSWKIPYCQVQPYPDYFHVQIVFRNWLVETKLKFPNDCKSKLCNWFSISNSIHISGSKSWLQHNEKNNPQLSVNWTERIQSEKSSLMMGVKLVNHMIWSNQK